MIISETRRLLNPQTWAARRSVRVMVAIVVAATAIVSRVSAQQAETTLACDKREVSYSAPDPTFEQRIKLSDAKESTIPSEARDKKRSPQGTRYLLLQSADFSKPGPWTTTVFIGGAGLSGQVLKVSFVDHGNGGVHAQWLNEKLLFLDVWWGRIASTDLILDVGSRKFLYKEDAEYGDMIQPCL